MEEEKDTQKNVGAEATTLETGATNATEQKISLDELLSNNKDYQSEYDKKVSQAMNTRIESERKKWEQEQKVKLEEAEKLAKMNEDEKTSYKMQELQNENTALKQKLTARDLESETIKQANEKGIPLDLINTFDFEKENAESISKKLDIFAKTLNESKEKIRQEYTKESAPQVGDRNKNTAPKSGYAKFLENRKK